MELLLVNKVALHTLGCKLNFSETSTIGNQFLSRGFEIVDFKEDADVYIFNTCSVTENAERECRQLVRRVIRQNPDAFVAVTGCYAQLRPQDIASIDGVDAVLGTKEKLRLFDILDNFHKRELACVFVSPGSRLDDFGPASSTDADSRTRAYLKIQDGCDYKCSFCTIPRARGLSRSMHPDKVIDDFRSLINRGYREIVLTGVNVGDYGKSFHTDLYNLLLRMVNINGNFRIRISSIEPNLLTDDIIELTAKNEKICRHFHIPLQSGSPIILKAMKRRYKVEDYRELIDKLHYRIPDIGIGVDVIVGFPGESEEEFHTTYNFIRDLDISYLHVFTYSERPDTPAADIPDQVDVFERRRRNRLLRSLSTRKKNLFYNTNVGQIADVLFEAENHSGQMLGFSSNYIRVSCDYKANLVNTLTPVKIKEAADSICTGEITVINKSIDSLAS
jgi:threonylcarbamoyladenosine tRNA methylthiotransferase MtaB